MEDQMSASGSSRIDVIIVNKQNGEQLCVRVNKSMQIENLVQAYSERASLDVGHVAFLYHGIFIQGKQTVDELGIVDGDNIYAYASESLGQLRNNPAVDLQEGSFGKSAAKVQEQDVNKILEMGKLSNYSFDELEERATGNFGKAMSFLKAAFLKSKLTEDARKCMGEVQFLAQSLDDAISAKIAAEKKVADRDNTIKQMNKDLQRANAEISAHLGEQSRLSEELSKAEIKLVEANKEIMNVRKDLESAKRSAALAEPQHKRKRSRLSGPVKIEPSAVVEPCKVDKDVVHGKMSVGREGKKLGDDSKCIYLQFVDHTGKSAYFKFPRNTQLLKVMRAYCSQRQKDLKSFIFKFNNISIETHQTPNELQMVDGDEIQVVQQHRVDS